MKMVKIAKPYECENQALNVCTHPKRYNKECGNEYFPMDCPLDDVPTIQYSRNASDRKKPPMHFVTGEPVYSSGGPGNVCLCGNYPHDEMCPCDE